MKNYQVIFLTFFANISFIFSQTTINGLVSDNQGLPLPGASIVEEGTSNGTTSDFDGIFTLEVSNNSYFR
jgi:iron complex outermembrane receptor protein